MNPAARRPVPHLHAGFIALLHLALLSSVPSPTARAEDLVTLPTRHATIAIDSRGTLTAFQRTENTRNYLAPNQPAPLLSLRIAGKIVPPSSATWEAPAHRLTLGFGDTGIKATLDIQAKATHATFEVTDLQPPGRAELAVWGPYPTTIREIIGEIIGVVRDSEFALGIQSLNAKTLGGYPTQENDADSGYGALDTGTYPDLPAELKQDQSFRGDTARHTDFGSVLQAYCRQRDQDRILENWGHERYLAPRFKDGGVVGSRIALFGCPAAQTLETIGAIELAEGLPHPMLDGVWAKASKAANSSYLIVDFSEQTADRAIEMTRRAGLSHLYHSSPFETWGHFVLKKSLFPNGREGLRACVEKARQAGVRIGFHTLSNFITPNDSYVTPRPDPRLARIGNSTLPVPIDASQKEIPVGAPDYFRKTTDMNTVVIGEELIRYGKLSESAPWRLLDCQRGAWGTKAADHAAGDTVGKLMDHGYKVFLTDADLTLEVARQIAKLCNETGTRQISLDGLEGAWSTGMGQYGRTLFTQAWYEALDPELRGTINDASNPGHFNWHVYTRMNWGEPWYAGFRESQTLYRFKNQLHFERNLMPHMLGWFALRSDTSLEDAEWLLARAAGFDAGFALASSLASTAQLEAAPDSADAAKQFGALPTILSAISHWETARLGGAFPAATKARLRDNNREFHLTASETNQWDLQEVQVFRTNHNTASSAATEFHFQHQNPAQRLQWTLRSTAKGPMAGVALLLNGHTVLDLQGVNVPAGGALRYVGGMEASICDASWKESARIPVDAAAAQVEPGDVRVQVRSRPQEGAALKVELRSLGTPERLVAGRPH